MIHYIGHPDLKFTEDKDDWANMDQAVHYLSQCNVIAVDTETEGMDFTCKKMIMLQIGNEAHQWVIDVRCTDITPLKNILEDEIIVKILQNVKFDYKFIKKCGIDLVNVYDTYLAERVLNCGRKGIKYGLDALVERYCGATLDKSVRNQFIGLEGKPYTRSQIVYGAKDVEYLCEIRRGQAKEIRKHLLFNVVALESKAALALAEIEYNGLDLDRDKWLEISVANENKATEYYNKLDNMVINDPRLQSFVLKYIQGDLFTDQKELRKVGVNWDSPKQVLAVFKVIIPDLENVNGKELYKHTSYGLVKKYVKYKEYMKLCTSYGKPFFKYFKSDGKIHTNFHQILDTGRISSSDPNMQQIPANNVYRNCFIPPEGWVFVSSDYSSQELNVIAFGSKDPVWIEALKQGQDLHSVCAELVYGDKWSKSAEDDCSYIVNKSKCNCPKHSKLRTNVKTINFGLAYGMGPHKLADTLSISMQDAKDLIKVYFAAFPAIGGFLNKLGNFGKQFGYIKTFPPYNRKRWFDTWYDKIWNHRSASMELGSIERASKNTPIQGASADMTKCALVLMHDYIRDNKIPVKLVMTVHDQIDTICKADYADEWKIKMTELMEEAAQVIVTNGLLKADTHISETWQK
tara:strand:- start:2882 stop:4774 length:1893 start_codon:yes stop_codon:yes gene_type:complete